MEDISREKAASTNKSGYRRTKRENRFLFSYCTLATALVILALTCLFFCRPGLNTARFINKLHHCGLHKYTQEAYIQNKKIKHAGF